MALNLYKSAVRSLRSGIVQRSLSSQSNDNYQRPLVATVSLNDEAPNLPKAIYLKNADVEAKTQVTVLSNGLRVASEPKFGQFCTVGKYLIIIKPA